MDIKFIGQGLNPSSDNTVGKCLSDSLSTGKYSSFRAFVAFISRGGLNSISEQLVSFKNNGGDIRLYVGIDLNATSEEALKYLLELEIETYIVFSPNSVIYHPKIFIFEGSKYSRTIVGSSNFTISGLFQNVEASVCVDFHNENDEIGIALLADIYEHFNEIINESHPSCQRLTKKSLDILVNSKTVLPEKIARAKNNKTSREFGEKDQESFDKLLELFAKLKPKIPPKITKKAVSKTEIKTSKEDKSTIVTEIIELQKNSMWIETRKMTGGSRNILDMSKKGKNNGTLIDGSVSYFGIDPEDENEKLNINIHHGGNIYNVNPIFYAPGNSNWRLQLKGVTDDGIKLTTISNMKLGEHGGFVNKILLFSLIKENDYKLDILEAEEIDTLISESTNWGKMGNETTGRAYGFI